MTRAIRSILLILCLLACPAVAQTTRPAMRVLNATSADLDLPRVAVLSNDLMWPGEKWSDQASRRTVPADAAIAAALAKALEADNVVGVVLDDTHRLELAQVAELAWRVKQRTGLPLSIFGLPGNTSHARNLTLPWNAPHAAKVFQRAIAMRDEPAWRPPRWPYVPPLARHVDLIAANLYAGQDMHVASGLEPIPAWAVVAEHAMHAAHAVGKPVQAWLWVPSNHPTPDAMADAMLEWCEARGLTVVLWDSNPDGPIVRAWRRRQAK